MVKPPQVTTFAPEQTISHPNLAEVESLLGGIGRTVFPDGTEQFQEKDGSTLHVFSPRLPLAELERFCEANLGHYQAHHDAHADALNNFQIVPMPHFWAWPGDSR